MPASQSSAQRQLARIENRVSKSIKAGIVFTPEAVARLNKLEAQLRVNSQGNKQLEMAFGETQNFFTQLNALSPTERTAKLASIKTAAQDEFKDYYAKQRTNLSEDFNTQIDRLNRDFNFANEDTMVAFKEKVAGLDRDTVDALSSAFRSVINRGLGSSGAMQELANRVLQQRTIAADQINVIRDTAIRDTFNKKNDRQFDFNTSLKREGEAINQDEKFNVKLEEQRLQDRQSNILLQSNELTGENELSPRVVKPNTSTLNPVDPISVRLAALQPETTNTDTNVVRSQQNMIQRRNNRLNRLNTSLL